MPKRPTLTRDFSTTLEVRGHENRTVYGLAVPFDRPTEIADAAHRYVERFRKGSFARTIAERGPAKVKFLAQHDRGGLPLGRAVALEEQQAGLFGEFAVSATRQGDEVLELIRDGALDGLSVGFVPMRDRWTKDRSEVERLEVALREVSAVWSPSYAEAAIAGVRHDQPQRITREAAMARIRLLELQ